MRHDFTQCADAERLERGEILYYPSCPFSVPNPEQKRFLLEGRFCHHRREENVTYDLQADLLKGVVSLSTEVSHALKALFRQFHQDVTNWLHALLPTYQGNWRGERVTFHPFEEATRQVPPEDRNDLLHVDAMEDQPTNGRRILRILVNLNPEQERVWLTSDTFAGLLEKHGARLGLPGKSENWATRALRLLPRTWPLRSVGRSFYDAFMIRFQQYLKESDDAQDKGVRKIWKFAPGSAWLAMTDGVSHAVLRGQFALELSLLVSPEVLSLPQESPAALFERAREQGGASRAA